MTTLAPIGNPISAECFLISERLRPITDHLLELIRQPNKHRPDGCLLIGEPYIGKSHLLKWVKRQIEMDPISLGSEIPCLYIDAPEGGNRRLFWFEVAEALGVPYSPSGNWESIFIRCLKQMRRVGTKVIFIDELNNFIVGPHRGNHPLLISIRKIGNALGIPTIAAGTEQALNAIERDKQSRSRLHPLAVPFLNPGAEFLGILKEFEMDMNVLQGTFSSKETAKFLYRQSNRTMGQLVRLLNESRRVAMVAKASEIDFSHIQMAAESELPWLYPKSYQQ